MKKITLFLFFSIFALFSSSVFFVAEESSAQPSSSKPGQAAAKELDSKNSFVTARLIADTKTITPGMPFKLGIELTMKPGWHTYYKEPGDAGIATKITWQLPSGFKNSDLYWQKPTKFEEGGIITYGYANKTLIAIKVIPPDNIAPAEKLNFSAQVKWLSCKDICVPGHQDVHFSLPVVSKTEKNSISHSENSPNFADANFEIPGQPTTNIDILNTPGQTKSDKQTQPITYFLFAIIGGFLLNFMPCVLPVIAIKILSLLEQPDIESTRKTVLAFSSGILSSFMLLGTIVISVQAAGNKIGWGFQFQQPIFLMVMSCLVLLFALSLLGLFDFSLHFGQKAVGNLADREGFVGDFFKGVLATILSTPCTAPFLGTALGFAFVESWGVTLSIFAAIGIGMCLPYMLLVIAPQYLRFLPKPGDWMTKLKEAFGFVLLATVVWLLSILYYQIPSALVINFMYFLLSVSFAVWLLNRFSNLASSNKRILIVRSLALLIIASSAYAFIFKNIDILKSTGKIATTSTASANDTKIFDLDTLNNAISSGKTVFLDFGAKWCLTCQLNESTVIDTKAVQDKFRSLNVLFLKADWTKQDPTVTKLLRKFERSGVPFYIIFPGKNPNKPIILPELLTEEMVLHSLDEAGPSIDKR